MKRRFETKPSGLESLKHFKREEGNEGLLIQIEPYDVNPHLYLDSKESASFKKAIQKQYRHVLEDFDDSKLNSEQKTIVSDLMKTNDPLVLITGEAGTGKTFVQYALIKRLKAEKENVYRIGPTHASVANLPEDSCTYQTFFSMKITTDYLDPLLKATQIKAMAAAAGRQSFIARAKHRSGQSVLIIEEAGMISAEVISRILLALGRIQTDKIRVLLFFDVLQLAPVCGKLLVNAQEIIDGRTLILRTNMRQKCTDSDFLDVLRALAKGTPDDSHYAILQSRRSKPNMDPGRRLCAKNVTVNLHNALHLKSLSAQTYTFRSEDKAMKQFPCYSSARMPGNLSWCIGAKVVFESSPLHDIGLYNGLTGIITEVVDTNTSVLLPVIYIDKYNLKVVVHPCTEEIMTDDDASDLPTVQALRTQFPFSIGAAMTVHKAQGQTLMGPVEIDFLCMTTPGQMYTACSRLTKLDDLFIKNLPPKRFNGGMEGLRVHPNALSWAATNGLFN